MKELVIALCIQATDVTEIWHSLYVKFSDGWRCHEL